MQHAGFFFFYCVCIEIRVIYQHRSRFINVLSVITMETTLQAPQRARPFPPAETVEPLRGEVRQVGRANVASCRLRERHVGKTTRPAAGTILSTLFGHTVFMKDPPRSSAAESLLCCIPPSSR